MTRTNIRQVYIASTVSSLDLVVEDHATPSICTTKKISQWFKKNIQRFISHLVLPAQFIHNHRAIHVSHKSPTFYINQKLCAKIFAPENAEPITPNTKFILYYPASGERFERHHHHLKELAKRTKAHVLVFNYRGVGTSKGKIYCAQDLIDDGEAALKYLLNILHIPQQNILLLGHSLGGAIATAVAAKYDNVNLCNDRSFASVSKIAIATKMLRHFLPPSVIKYILKKTNWEIDSIQNYAKVRGRKFIIYSKKDKIIPYHIASLHKFFPLDDALSLPEEKKSHNLDLSESSVFETFVAKVQEILGIPS